MANYQGTFGISNNEHDTWLEPELELNGECDQCLNRRGSLRRICPVCGQERPL